MDPDLDLYLVDLSHPSPDPCAQAVQQLLAMRAESSGEDGLADARLDLGKLSTHVSFLNNLEKDPMYNR